ncbi:Hypothetical protein CINCED_3A011969 [Cinara cedri]|uniref:Uncharacterized protein n=1 Tax=Cinara cedri TaxID=506608 RepID=A0A5E4NCT9_9HEMI|nr:Hypothetical protein CINCED_3A011969 [Cinara cedri]
MDGHTQSNLLTNAEMQNILTELKNGNEQLRRQVSELQASKNLQQIKIVNWNWQLKRHNSLQNQMKKRSPFLTHQLQKKLT